jgi:predicted  nucleic acid-binding Zn-ribbon protein
MLKNNQDKQSMIQEIELLGRERLQFVEKIELTENILEKQQNLFESKIQVLKEKLKIYKDEIVELKRTIDNHTQQNIERQKMVFYEFIKAKQRQSGMLNFLNTIAVDGI